MKAMPKTGKAMHACPQCGSTARYDGPKSCADCRITPETWDALTTPVHKEKAQHTAGPWQWHTHKGEQVLSSSTGAVLSCLPEGMPLPVDARLIAAAPEQNSVLVELAEEFADRLRQGIGCDPDDLKRYLKAMNPAISKAQSGGGV